MSTESTSPNPWIYYSDQPPEKAGIYEWRLPSKTLPGCHVTFLAHMRERGAGYETVLSPNFDYWTGYRVVVPVCTQWRAAPEDAKCKSYENANIAVEGLAFAACPYCQRVPVLEGQDRNGSGVRVCPEPHELNSWSLRCCSWGSTPSLADPRQIEATRQAAFAVIRAS